jgi:hypothetical protein
MKVAKLVLDKIWSAKTQPNNTNKTDTLQAFFCVRYVLYAYYMYVTFNSKSRIRNENLLKEKIKSTNCAHKYPAAYNLAWV